MDLEDFKYLIDSRNLSERERIEERDALTKARADRFAQRSEEDIKSAKLMQLKLQMEEYINTLKHDFEPLFSKFLEVYADTLFDKRKEFASDVSVEPIALSHILNGHREPNDTFLIKLIRHSQDSYNRLGGFNKELWPMIFYRDKVNGLLKSLEKPEAQKNKWVKSKSTGKFEIRTDKSGQYRFNLKAVNGQVILTSEAYTTKNACEKGIASVRINSQLDRRYIIKTAKDGSPFFKLKASNGQIIGASEMYSSKSSMSKGISSVKKNAPKAKIKSKAK